MTTVISSPAASYGSSGTTSNYINGRGYTSGTVTIGPYSSSAGSYTIVDTPYNISDNMGWYYNDMFNNDMLKFKFAPLNLNTLTEELDVLPDELEKLFVVPVLKKHVRCKRCRKKK